MPLWKEKENYCHKYKSCFTMRQSFYIIFFKKGGQHNILIFRFGIGQIWPTACFYLACDLRMSFTFLNDWKQIESQIMFHDMWEIYEIQISGFINIVLLEWNHTHPSAYCPLWLFLNKAESGGYDRDHMAHRPGMSAPSPSTETICWLWLWYLTYVSGERKLGTTSASVKG